MGHELSEPWLYPDELSVVSSFAEAGVRFIVIGGRAVQFHGRVRPAKDLDLLVEFSAENWAKLAIALRPLNAGVPPFEGLSQNRKFQAKLNRYPTVEFITAIDGVSFAEAWTECVEATFEGVEFRVLSKAHLIVSKQSRLSPVDVDDIRSLQG